MKILILTFLALFSMELYDIEDFLYKHIDNFPYDIVEKKISRPGIKAYKAKGNFVFFGESYNHLTIYTNKNDTIQKFTLGVPGTIDRPMYDKMVAKYGVPDEMTKKDKEIIGEPSTSANGITAIEGTYTLKACTFEENPLYIVWKKEDHIIKILCNQDNRMTVKYLYIEIGKVNHYSYKDGSQIFKLYDSDKQ